MLLAGHIPTPHAHRLASLLQALLTFSPVLLQFQSNHISGHSNNMPGPTVPDFTCRILGIRYVSATDGLAQMHTLPHELQFVLLGCITGTGTEAISAGRTIVPSITELAQLIP